MLYYRFRPPSEVNFKELLYSEMYFASGKECNDPFDSKFFYEFEPDHQRWEKLFELALGNLTPLLPSAAQKAAANIVKRGCITFDEAIATDFRELFRLVLDESDAVLAIAIADRVAHTLNLYKPEANYFVSFSKRCDKPLMWSHYAGQHEGFCLVFRSIDGMLKQNPLALKTSIRRDTPHSKISPSMTYGLPKKFKFRDVTYCETAEHLCAFDRFPASVAMKELSKKQRKELALKHEEQYCQKHQSWSYEEESRVALRALQPWLSGDHFELTNQERLFQYEPCQLVGVIFGARMSEEHKARIHQIIKERSDRIAVQCNYKRTIFDFLLQEARLSSRHRQVSITPTQFHGRRYIKTGDEKFESTYRGWLAGAGLELDGNKGTNVVVPD